MVCSKKYKEPAGACTIGVVHKILLACRHIYVGQIGRCFNDCVTVHRRYKQKNTEAPFCRATYRYATTVFRPGSSAPLQTTRRTAKKDQQKKQGILEQKEIAQARHPHCFAKRPRHPLRRPDLHEATVHSAPCVPSVFCRTHACGVHNKPRLHFETVRFSLCSAFPTRLGNFHHVGNTGYATASDLEDRKTGKCTAPTQQPSQVTGVASRLAHTLCTQHKFLKVSE